MTEDLSAYMLDLGARARAASKSLAGAPTEAKNAALVAIADAIAARTQAIKSANRQDLDQGRLPQSPPARSRTAKP
jgi:glutamate-5-semialdehyde dehydrogenase